MIGFRRGAFRAFFFVEEGLRAWGDFDLLFMARW